MTSRQRWEDAFGWFLHNVVGSLPPPLNIHRWGCERHHRICEDSRNSGHSRIRHTGLVERNNKALCRECFKALGNKKRENYYSNCVLFLLGHTYAWGLGYPELLTQCYDSQGPIPGHFGPMNPARNYTYRFLSMFFKEILGVFKDQFVHLGNDEVPLACW